MASNILLVGCGNMGFAMLKGWLSAMTGLIVHVVEPDQALANRAEAAGAIAVSDTDDLPGDLQPELVFLAVKPQVMGRIVADYARFAGGTSTFVSIAAGTTIATLARHLPGPTPIIRCMP